MQVFRKTPILITLLILGVSCGPQRPEHQVIAQEFAETLHNYIEHPTHRNQMKLEKTASHYTVQLASDSAWIAPLAVHGDFEYGFLRDSVDKDNLRAYVWYMNLAQPGKRVYYRVSLRRTLTSWVVDLPLI